MNAIQFEQQTIYPQKIICIGKNYHAHIQEMNNEVPNDMVVFTKPNTAISERIYFVDENCHFETELCFLIENGQYRGIGIGFDLTKRAVQSSLVNKGLPWERAKAFDRSAVFTPFIPIDFLIESLEFELLINGDVRQHGEVAKMIFKPNIILSDIQSFMHLCDGDVIMSGTPAGVASFSLGDAFRVKLLHRDEKLIDHSWIVQ